MAQCNEYIEIIYRHPKIAEFIGSIQPEQLQDDLKQEMAMALLEYDCERLAQIYHRGELVQFTMGILWKMGRLQKGKFYKTFKRSNLERNLEYMRRLLPDNTADRMSAIALKVLNDKMVINANEAHESMIFHSYVELGTCKKVAEYYGIPKHHVDKVVSKCKAELKRKIKNSI